MPAKEKKGSQKCHFCILSVFPCCVCPCICLSLCCMSLSLSFLTSSLPPSPLTCCGLTFPLRFLEGEGIANYDDSDPDIEAKASGGQVAEGEGKEEPTKGGAEDEGDEEEEEDEDEE